MKKKIIIIAGDKSGDLYGGYLAEKLQEAHGEDVELFSFGGPHLKESTKQLIDLVSHSVTGIVEIIAAYRHFLKLYQQARKEIERIQPDLIIPIDFPEFNLKLAKELNRRFRLFYYISPQVWAWRKNRINIIRDYVEKMIVIFRFEKEFYEKEGIDALYFGHPLLEIITASAQNNPEQIITLLPGSRRNEIKKHLPVMLEAKKLMEKNLEGYRFQLIRPPHLSKTFYEPFIEDEDIAIVEHSYANLSRSRFVLTSSGTATVELAILEIPFLIMYRVNPLTWLLLRNIVSTEHIGMVNILIGRRLIKEFMQREANAENISAYSLEVLGDEKKYTHLKTSLAEIKDKLTPYQATEKLAEFIAVELGLESH